MDWDAWDGDPFAVVDDPNVSVVVECIGGVRLARELVLRAIAHGKDVVTANKELIAQDGPWLRAFAARTGATLHYEASVGGAIPILRALETSLADEPILEVGGVVNGTTNFVLSQMESGASYADGAGRGAAPRLRRSRSAQRRRGHRRRAQTRDPRDAGVRRPGRVRVDSRAAASRAIDPADVTLAAERGWRLKLVALARRTSDGIEAGVTPAFVARNHPFARPNDAENIVRVVGAQLGCARVLRTRRGRRCVGVERRRRHHVGDRVARRGVAPRRGVVGEAARRRAAALTARRAARRRRAARDIPFLG